MDAPADATAEDLVRLDEIGTPGAPPDDLRAVVYAPGLPETARRRLLDDERFEVTEDPDDLASCGLALLSTRIPRGEIGSLVAQVTRACEGPLVVLAHTGGEALAVDLVRQGAVAVLGEGDELSIATVLTGSGGGSGLLDAYDRSQGDARVGVEGRGIDPATGLLDRAAMRARTEEVVHGGDAPRVAFVRLLNVPSPPREMSHEAITMLRRRIAVLFVDLAERAGAQVFSLGDVDFGVLGTELSPNGADDLARAMQQRAATFVPSGIQPLAVAFGHAGPEVATEAQLLHELATRAVDLAAQDRTGSIVSAELLALGMASSTELQSTMQVLETLERRLPGRDGHGRRVAALAARLAAELGYEGAAQSRIRLAAHLHEIGRANLPAAALADTATLDAELLQVHRSHPARGADYVRPVAGEEVADVLRTHAERWDGTGFPDGLGGHAIPVGARIVATAVAAVEALDAAEADGPATADDVAAAALAAEAGSRLDPDLVEVCSDLLRRGEHPVALAS